MEMEMPTLTLDPFGEQAAAAAAEAGVSLLAGYVQQYHDLQHL